MRFKSRSRVEIRPRDDWWGVSAAGDFGRIEGWIRLGDTAQGPPGFDVSRRREPCQFCARTGTGDILMM